MEYNEVKEKLINYEGHMESLESEAIMYRNFVYQIEDDMDKVNEKAARVLRSYLLKESRFKKGTVVKSDHFVNPVGMMEWNRGIREFKIVDVKAMFTRDHTIRIEYFLANEKCQSGEWSKKVGKLYYVYDPVGPASKATPVEELKFES